MAKEVIEPPAPGTVFAPVAEATAFAVRLLMAHKLPEADARTVAHCLVLADLRGVDTHGIQYLPHYLGRVDKGLINPRAEPATRAEDAGGCGS